MTIGRTIETVVLALLTILTGLLLVSLQYEIVADAPGDGEDGFIWPGALIPLGAAALCFRHTGWRRAARRAGMIAFTVALMAAQVTSYAFAERTHDRRAGKVDRIYACHDPQIDSRVNAAFRTLPHPEPLYRLVDSDHYGCTAAIYGSAEQTFGPWREALLTSGWTVADDDADRVRVTQGDLQAVLYRDGDTALLHITANEPPQCDAAGAGADEGEVVAC